MEAEAEKREFLPSAEGSGVSWTDKHLKKSFTAPTDYRNPSLSFLHSPLFFSLADWFPWVVNGQELESATGKYYRHVAR